MSKFLLTKRFPLDFLGKEWKEQGAYLDFNAFTVRDVREKLPKLANIDEADNKSVDAGVKLMLELLKDKFVGGKAVTEKKELVDVTSEDLEELPVEAVSKAVGFLSQGLANPAPKPSETP